MDRSILVWETFQYMLNPFMINACPADKETNMKLREGQHSRRIVTLRDDDRSGLITDPSPAPPLQTLTEYPF